MRLRHGFITYRKGEEVDYATFDFREYESRDIAEEMWVNRRINYLESCGATITDVIFNSITYVRDNVEYVDVIMLYDERGFERVETPRFCTKCGALLWEGYVDGDDCYCEECFPYSDEEWQKMYDEYPDYCYWTQWY